MSGPEPPKPKSQDWEPASSSSTPGGCQRRAKKIRARHSAWARVEGRIFAVKGLWAPSGLIRGFSWGGEAEGAEGSGFNHDGKATSVGPELGGRVPSYSARTLSNRHGYMQVIRETDRHLDV